MAAKHGDDRTGNPARGAFFAVVIKDVGQGRLVRRGQQIGGRGAGLAHPHVKRAIAHERKAAFRLIKLHRRHTKVQHHAVQPFAANQHQLGADRAEKVRPAHRALAKNDPSIRLF